MTMGVKEIRVKKTKKEDSTGLAFLLKQKHIYCMRKG